MTLAEVLHGAGYYTAISGKWHVGNEHGVGPMDARVRPIDRAAARRAVLPRPDHKIRADYAVHRWPRGSHSHRPKSGTGTGMRRICLSVGLTLRAAEAKDKPFFLYLPFTAPHFPLMAPPEDIARFKGRVQRGGDALRR